VSLEFGWRELRQEKLKLLSIAINKILLYLTIVYFMNAKAIAERGGEGEEFVYSNFQTLSRVWTLRYLLRGEREVRSRFSYSSLRGRERNRILQIERSGFIRDLRCSSSACRRQLIPLDRSSRQLCLYLFQRFPPQLTRRILPRHYDLPPFRVVGIRRLCLSCQE